MIRLTFAQTGRPYPFLPVRIAVTNPLTARQITLSENCKVDTGFNGDIFVAGHNAINILNINVSLYSATTKLADGREVPGGYCFAQLERIANHIFSPSIEITLICCGEPEHSLLGLRLLNKWISEFHGPKQLLSLMQEQPQ